jgi:GH15 family glucan-1,4-alpha-glucosidase
MINESAYGASLALLKQASTGSGFVASVAEHDNYRRIWTRDGTINSLAALLTANADLIRTAKATIETIFTHQHPSGFMPSNVTPNGSVSYGGTVGRADNPSWAVIGLCQYVLFTGDTSLANRFGDSVKACFSVMDAWEYNGKHLIYVPQSGDWADEYIQHGYVLFNQLLRIWALRLAAEVYEQPLWLQKSKTIEQVVCTNFYNNQAAENLYAPNLKHQLQQAPIDFWFLGFNPSRIYSQFDLQANLLTILLGIGTQQQNDTLASLIKGMYAQMNHLLPSFFPAIGYGDKDMPELENNYAYSFRNLPGEFHNGGLWPVWNGWLAAALCVLEETGMAVHLTDAIAKANSLNNNEFNECLHGETGKPIGVPHCTWSAGGFLLAASYLQGKRLFI